MSSNLIEVILYEGDFAIIDKEELVAICIFYNDANTREIVLDNRYILIEGNSNGEIVYLKNKAFESTMLIN